jgi:ribosomal-protein-alanine acetyltransferase
VALVDGKGQNRRKTYRWEAEDIRRLADISFTEKGDYEAAIGTYAEGFGEELTDVRHSRALVWFKKGCGKIALPFYLVVDSFTALDGDRPIAYVIGRLIAPEAEIYRVAVRTDKRRRGIGYRLLDYAIKTERGRGLESVFLEVRESNVPARNLYRAHGFREISLRKNYYHNPTENAVIMFKGNSSLI